MFNYDVLVREEITSDELIDAIEGNRRYIKCLYVYNKVDTCFLEDLEPIIRRKNSVLISAHLKLNLDGLMSEIWRILDLVRIYTKKKGEDPDFTEPVILTKGRGGCTIKRLCTQIHKDLLTVFKAAKVWGKSVKFNP